MNNQQEKTLLPRYKRLELKKMAHHLKPVVQIGKKGITEGLTDEIDQALEAHELIKLHVLPKQSLSGDDLARILSRTKSHHIDSIGNVVILFRAQEASAHS
jgi:RNA-binding protein